MKNNSQNRDERKPIRNRRSIRLKGYNYSKPGLYFITIYCDDRKCRFGNIVGAEFTSAQKMQLTEYGTIAYNEWIKLPGRFPNVKLDVFQIMPNHMHGIIILTNVGAGFTPAPNNTKMIVGAGLAPALNDGTEITGRARVNPAPTNDTGDGIDRAGASPARTTAPTIGDIVGAYKSLVAKGCLDIFKQQHAPSTPRMGKLWQRDYFEHIIRDEQSYQNIVKYIIENPGNWKEDRFYLP